MAYMTKEEVDNRVTYHPPTENTIPLHQKIREYVKEGMELASDLPQSRETSVAITKLEEFMFWANASVARNQ